MEISPASETAALGLLVNAGPIVDPGYAGAIKFSIFNAKSVAIPLPQDLKVLQLRFFVMVQVDDSLALD